MHVKKTLSHLLLLAAFATLAIGSASSSQERKENLDFIKDTYEFGSRVKSDILSDNALPADAADSTAVVTLRETAIR